MIIINTQEELESLIINRQIIVRHDIIINCDVKVDADLCCRNLYAHNITARNFRVLSGISAYDLHAKGEVGAFSILAANVKANSLNGSVISVNSIKAKKIICDGVCWAWQDIVCDEILLTHEKAKHFSIDGKVIIRKETNEQR